MEGMGAIFDLKDKRRKKEDFSLMLTTKMQKLANSIGLKYDIILFKFSYPRYDARFHFASPFFSRS